MAEHNKLGKKGEDLASDFLKHKNYSVIERSWHYKHKEIDIIAFDNDVLVFVEVKSRTDNYWGNPEEFVTKRKQKFLIEAAEQYINEQKFSGESRFDIIAITFGKNDHKIEHIENAFYP
ncbi:MAG: YraN family protein [Bacteroidales bacterium]|jgi:putative endonuclease|nr:YraN family protein [Bacteroidales bacterium]